MQYTPKKHDKFGIKFWMAADVNTKYMLHSIPYLGKDDSGPAVVELGEHVVLQLFELYRKTGQNVTADNFFASVNPAKSRQRGRTSKGVVFTTTLIEWSGFNPHPGHVVTSLDKTLYDDYLCLVASNKQQIQWTRIRRNLQEH